MGDDEYLIPPRISDATVDSAKGDYTIITTQVIDVGPGTRLGASRPRVHSRSRTLAALQAERTEMGPGGAFAEGWQFRTGLFVARACGRLLRNCAVRAITDRRSA